MSQIGEAADVGMAMRLRSQGGPVADHVAVEWTHRRNTAGTSHGFGARVSSTSSTVSRGLYSTVATIFGWASRLGNLFGSPIAGHGHDEAEARELLMNQWLSEQNAPGSVLVALAAASTG